MMNIESSQNYQTFYQYIFGDYRYFYYDGIPEVVCTSLEGSERIEAEKLVLQALKKIFLDERAVRAAGYLKLKAAIPVLEERLAILSIFMRKEVRSSIVWALLKIRGDKGKLGEIIEVVNGRARLKGLTRADAIELLSDFGEEPFVVDTLLHAFLAEDVIIYGSAQYALRKIFRDNQAVSDLFKLHPSAPALYVRDSIAKHIQLQRRN